MGVKTQPLSNPGAVSSINRKLMLVTAFWAFFLALLVSTDVLMRGLFNSPITGVVEIIKNSIVIMVFLQMGYVVFTDSMLKADFFTQHLSPGSTRLINGFNALAGAFLFGLMAYSCIEPMAGAFQRGEFEGEGALRIQTWPVYCVLIFGSGWCSLNYILSFIRKYDTNSSVG
jgi:TRAP-type C4-dicarboxylate transport system permease small subunit